MAGRYLQAADALHPDSARRAGLVWQASMLGALADALEGVTAEGVDEVERALDLWVMQYGKTPGAATRVLVALRAMLDSPEPPDGMGRVVGSIERTLREG